MTANQDLAFFAGDFLPPASPYFDPALPESAVQHVLRCFEIECCVVFERSTP